MNELTSPQVRRELPGWGYPPDSIDPLLRVTPPPEPEAVIPRSICDLCYPLALEVAGRLLLSMAMHPRSIREHQIPVRVVDEIRCRHIIIDGIAPPQLAATAGEFVLAAVTTHVELTD